MNASLRILFVVSISAVLVGGCATVSTGDSVAEAKTCKVAPIVVGSPSIGNKTPKYDRLEQVAAQSALANSSYRREQLAARGPDNNLIEESLRNCY